MFQRRAAKWTGAVWLLGLGLAHPSAVAAATGAAVSTARWATPTTVDGAAKAAGTTSMAAEAASPGAGTDPASHPLIKGDLRTFDVTGFKLGMSPAEAQRVAAAAHLLASNGSRKVPFDPALHGTRGADFQLIVARAAAARLGRPRPAGPAVVTEVLLYGPDGDKYELDFLPMEDGPRLSNVLLITSAKGNSPQSFLDAVIAKYGKLPSRRIGDSDGFARWCTRGDAQCSDLPSFTVSGGQIGAELRLTFGDRQRIMLDRRIEAAGAAAAAALAGKPTL